MDYKINESFIRKIQTPILCKIGDNLEEFANGTELAEIALEKLYEVVDIRTLDNKIMLSLREQKRDFITLNWVGEEAIWQMSQYDSESEPGKQCQDMSLRKNDFSIKGNLLIIGAGGHGKVVKEVAEALKRYQKIDFVDDNSPEAVGKISDLEKLRKEYGSAFVSIGNNHLRSELLQKLKNMRYEIPILIHPSAYVSKTCKIESGTVIGPKAIISTNTYIGAGSIISAGAIIDHDVIMEPCVHIDVGAIVKAGGKVKKEIKLKAGEVLF